MRRTHLFLFALSLTLSPCVHAQDAATEERLNKLSGQIEDLIASQKEIKERISALYKELENVREHASKPNANYAAQDDVNRLREAIKEVDRKRIEDSERTSSQLMRLGKIAAASPPSVKKFSSPAASEAPEKEKPTPSEKGYKYTIQKNDTLSIIVQAYREKNVKVTTEQILKANPGLTATKLRVGQEIWIPAPAKSEGSLSKID